MHSAPVDWHYPTEIRFGQGRVNELPAALRSLGITRPLVVTDEGLAGLPMVSELMASLSPEFEAALYCKVKGNPTGANVQGGVDCYVDGGHDGVVALGGGSALDVGKSIALVAGRQRPLWDFVDGAADPWLLANPEEIAPIIAIPTTAGTGSEVGRAAVILDESERRKKIIFHPGLVPDIVISDPGLTVGLPPDLTAWTGIDALVHSLEAFCAPGYHPMADGIAVEAIGLVLRYLPRAVADGADIEARGQMLVAASMGATAFQKGLGSIHSISHVVGALYDTHHGLTNAVVLPYGLLQNAAAIEGKLAHLCRVLQIEHPGGRAFIDAMFRLRQELGVPATLADIGVEDAQAERIGALAMEEGCTATNARPLDAGDLQRLFLAAHSGDRERL